jgi:glycosyltransferase involved in cell wall biosynthesis
MNPLVSIIIPTYNRADDLEYALESVIAQTYSNWEVWVIDNHSEDNTDDVVKGFNDSRIKLIKIHNEGLIAASRNLGIEHSTGTYIAFLDSDDWWMPEKLEESVKYLEQGLDIVYHDLLIVKKRNQKIFWKKAHAKDLKKPVFRDLLANGCALMHSSVVLRKNVLVKAGGLPEDRDMNNWGDIYAWLCLAKHTDKFKKLPKAHGYYWLGGGNFTTPKRTIAAINRFESIFKGDIKDLNLDSIFWLDYTKGRLYYRMKLYEMARENLELVSFQQAPFLIYVKTLWMLFLIRFTSKEIPFTK